VSRRPRGGPRPGRGGPGRGGPGRQGERRLVFGAGPAAEILRARPGDVRRVVCADADSKTAERARAAGVPFEVASRAALDALAGPGAVHQGVVVEVGPYRYAALEDLVAAAEESAEPALLVALDGVTDPHNLGAVIRSAYLFGAHGVVIPQDRAAPVSAVTTKASAGATELLKVARVVNLARALEELRDAGVWRAALAAGEGAVRASELDGVRPLCLVLGSEGKGIRRLVRERCDVRVEIPMEARGVGSLNVSVAAGVILYEVARQRRAARS
jgi:23S rRNA (guanosine2251-2'-O)-methyltransferase